MKLTDDLKDARLSIVRTAELASMHPAHFRRLVRRGVFPEPKRTPKGRPYLDYELLAAVAGILKGGVGKNGEEIVFYRRKPKTNATRGSSSRPEPVLAANGYLTDLAEGLKQVGVPENSLAPTKLKAALEGINDVSGGCGFVFILRHSLLLSHFRNDSAFSFVQIVRLLLDPDESASGLNGGSRAV